MRFGYTATVRGQLSEDEQRSVLKETGVEDRRIFSDGVPDFDKKTKKERREERDELTRILRPGDQIIVVAAAIAARSTGRLFRWLSTVTAKGASLFVVDQQKEFTCTTEHAEIAEAMEGDKGRAQTATARNTKRKRKGGRPPALVLDGERKAVFIRMWNDEHTDIAAMQRKFGGVSRATIQRRAADLNLGHKA